MNNWIN